MGKGIFTQVQEVQRVPDRINLWSSMSRHIQLKIKKKIKDKEKKKGTRGKHQIIYKGIPIILSADFSAETP